MRELGSIDSLFAAMDPTLVGRFLTKQGFRLVGSKSGLVELYKKDADVMLVLPTDRGDPRFGQQVRDVLELFTDGQTTLDDVVGLVVWPDSDIFRYRLETPETFWGQIRLSYTQEAMQALFAMLRFTAAGVSSQKVDYRGVSESARTFGDQCRFGQTEYGSFVLKVFCPTNPIGISSLDLVGEPFGRTTTRALLENFEYLSSERSEDPAQPLPPTLNRQVADAVARLHPRVTLGVTAEVGMRFAPLSERDADNVLPQPGKVEIQSVDLGPFIYSRAQAVRERLKKAEEFGRELLRGFIVTLHKDRPVEDEEQSHEITIDIRYGLGR